MAFGKLITAATSKGMSAVVKLGLSLLKTGKVEVEARGGERWIIIFSLDFYISAGKEAPCLLRIQTNQLY